MNNTKWTYELYDDGETFAVYDDGNMIAHCLSPEDARIIVVNHDDVHKLTARIAELEAENNRLSQKIDRVVIERSDAIERMRVMEAMKAEPEVKR